MFHRVLKESLGWIRGSYLFRQMIVTIMKRIRKLIESHVNTEYLFKWQRLIRGKVVYWVERMANM